MKSATLINGKNKGVGERATAGDQQLEIKFWI